MMMIIIIIIIIIILIIIIIIIIGEFRNTETDLVSDMCDSLMKW